MPNIDFNGDGRSDVLWLLNQDVAVSNWLGSASGGFTINDANAYTQLNIMHTFRFETTGDFNGDGRTDVMWQVDPQNGTGDRTIWLTDPEGGFSITGPQLFFAVNDLSWQVAGAGDFNGDGVDDLLWRNGNGTISNWLGSSSGNFTINDANALTGVPNDWQIVGVGDFNGDGRDDLLWQSNDGYISNWLGTATGGYAINDANALASMRVPVIAIGDLNGDQREDVVIQDDWSFYSVLYADAGGGLQQTEYNPFALFTDGWSIVGAGDYNGDGIDDLLWRHVDGRFSNWLGTPAENSFAVNDANALASIPLDWQTIDSSLF